MRLRLLALATLLALPVVALAPTAGAVAICVDNSPAVVQDCSYWLACVGRSGNQYYETCQIAVDYPCRYCMPM